ncbi:von Willebrand factor, type A [Pyrobaculum islandicum DSM 4184]|uniref:von Willebrand factor, type A n=1 Tax=Pyrobaculum islandicum (strain DSM 4184 / JCM 9189 / GEO3) TaxID=384616 RepID=A1RSU5_PYRIL|nr:VWA domain-containing protein [Pyrobaculum islandicum]ABL88027.1 von Willebrand factor, type A [Pyrobaculum islandicum DSM 4184]
MNELIDILASLYECLGGISVRSLIYAIADIYARSHLGVLDREKILEILAQNLAGSLRTSPGNAKKIIESAIDCIPNARVISPAPAIGSVGVEKAPTLAHVVNKYVSPDASPRVKLEVIRRINLPQEAVKEVEAKITARSEGFAYIKSAVKSIKQYYPYVSISDVDLIRTAMSIARKALQNKPISDTDIYIREYIHIVDKPIYIALDVSGSMKEYIGALTKLKVAKNAIARYLHQMAHLRGLVSLVLFNTDADFMWTPHPVNIYLRDMIEILKYIYAMGGTELASALELLQSHEISRDIVIITDGRTHDPDKVLNLAKRFKRLHIVATEKSQFLKSLAKTTGGKYRELTPTLNILEVLS